MTGWSDLHDRRVGVWGLGVEGRATLARLAADGVTPVAVVATDQDDLEPLTRCDIVIKSPGISPYDPPALRLVEAGVEVAVGLGLWLADAPADRVVCITGTKGKSTTASIAGALATGLGADCFTGGNLGAPPWDPAAAKADWYVIETSSYQARDLQVGPRVVVVTSLSQDHLVWHHGYDAYVRDKLRLCTLPGVEVVLAPAGDAELDRHRELLGDSVTSVDEEEPAWVAGLGLLGRHNVRNALLARRALIELGVPGAADDDAVHRATRGYRPLRSRLTPVGTVETVEFVDDSLSTNTLPTLAAVDAFPGRRVALLVGGQDRGIDYAPLGVGLAGRPDPVLVVTMPDNGPRIADALARSAPGLDVRRADDLREAVQLAYQWARPDGVVLLSPAAPSFGRFYDYTERADVFEAAMRELVPVTEGHA